MSKQKKAAARVWAVALWIWCAGLAHAADRAVIVGIENYEQTAACNDPKTVAQCVRPTLGGLDDADVMARLVSQMYGFRDIRVLKGPQATAQAIKNAFQSLIRETAPGDRVFFFFSGHGSQMPDDNGDEADKLDEVIAPYDVAKYPTRNIIRDDQFNEWLRQLPGRQVVAVFDSCHSGTLSRAPGDTGKYLPLPEVAEFKSKNRGFGLPQSDYSPLPVDDLSRDLFVASEMAEAPGQGSSVVFITAAQPYQKAFSIPAGSNRYQGALVYALQKVHAAAQGGPPSVHNLEVKIRAEVEQLGPEVLRRQPGKPDEVQLPSVEIVSGCANGSEPLFALSQAATCQLDNTANPNLSVQLRFLDSKQVYFYNNAGEYDTFNFEVTLNRKAYLYMLAFSGQDEKSGKEVATCIFPHRRDGDNHLSAGTHRFPRAGAPAFRAQAPAGRDVWVALATTRPLDICEKIDYETWDELFNRIGLPKLQRLVERQRKRGVGVEPDNPLRDDEWQAATQVLETRKR